MIPKYHGEFSFFSLFYTVSFKIPWIESGELKNKNSMNLGAYTFLS